MNMITRKKLIAALLIPIMLIAFSTPSFAASTTSGFDVKAFADKALGFVMDIGDVSLERIKTFAGDFMNISSLDDVLERIPTLAETGFEAIGGLVDAFTSTDFTSVPGALKIIPKLLKVVVETGIDFCKIIFPSLDLTSPSSVLQFTTKLFGFAVESGKLLADVVLENVDLNDIGNSISGLLTGSSVGDLSEIFNTLLQSGNTQIPSLDLNFDKTNFIQLLGSVTGSMGGPIGDILDSGIDIVGGLLNSLTATDPGSSQNIVDFTNTLTNSISGIAGIVENTIADKPVITDIPSTTTTNLNRPQYEGYTLIVEQGTLENVVKYIQNSKLFNDNESVDWTGLYALNYACLLENREWNENNIDMLDSQMTSKPGGLSTLYEYMTSNNAKPAIVRIEDSYKVTCIGYKGDGTQISDFLFIDTLTGTIKRGGEGKISHIDPMDQTDAISVFK